MKILISAYACEPNKGSEPGIGWNWALHLSKMGHSVTVITRKNNKIQIDKEIKKKKLYKKIHFIYYDCSNFFLKIKNTIPGGIYLYYYLWQFSVYNFLKKNININEYHLIHHLTFGVFRLPSFLSNFNKPFIFGPVGGGEIINKHLFWNLSINDKFKELLRIFSNYIFFNYDLNLIKCLKKSKYIFTKNFETKKIIDNKFRIKTSVLLEIGSNFFFKKKLKKKKIFKILFLGRHIYWKGGELLIAAFNKSIQQNNNLQLSFVGNGPDKNKWIKLSKKLKLSSKIKFYNKISQKNLNKLFSKNDILILPSYHDSSSNVVLEALSHSVPVICLKIGGPPTIVDNKSGYSINLSKVNNFNDIVNLLSKKIILVSKNFKLYEKLSSGAYKRAQYFHWPLVIGRLYKNIKF